MTADPTLPCAQSERSVPSRKAEAVCPGRGPSGRTVPRSRDEPAASEPTGNEIDWGRVKRCLIAARCPFGSCPVEQVPPDRCPHRQCPFGYCPLTVCPW